MGKLNGCEEQQKESLMTAGYWTSVFQWESFEASNFETTHLRLGTMLWGVFEVWRKGKR